MSENHFPTKLMDEQHQINKIKEKVFGTAAFGIIFAALYWLVTSPLGKEINRIVTTVPDK